MKQTVEGQIIEGNKLIAEFEKTVWPMASNYIWLNECKYHTSWDWLMPVVQKCWKVYGESGAIDTTLGLFHYNKVQIHSPIEAVWLAVVVFIKWYNQNNQSA